MHTAETAPLERVTIPRRFCGPPASANGGYVCGVLARSLGTAAKVTLRRPVPLDQPLAIVSVAGGRALSADGAIIADAVPAALQLDVPPPLRLAVAESAALGFVSGGHPFPTCFVCGPQRADGLRIFAGPIPGTDLVAASWTPAEDLGDPEGQVHPEFVWAALDCPGAFAVANPARQPVVLGRLTVDLRVPLGCGEPHIVLGWPLGRDGRKLFAGTAIYSERGDLAACGLATWVDVGSKRDALFLSTAGRLARRHSTGTSKE